MSSSFKTKTATENKELGIINSIRVGPGNSSLSLWLCHILSQPPARRHWQSSPLLIIKPRFWSTRNLISSPFILKKNRCKSRTSEKGEHKGLMEINNQRSRQTGNWVPLIYKEQWCLFPRASDGEPASKAAYRMHYKKTTGFAPGVLTVNFCPDTDSFTLVCTLKQGDNFSHKVGNSTCELSKVRILNHQIPRWLLIRRVMHGWKSCLLFHPKAEQNQCL